MTLPTAHAGHQMLAERFYNFWNRRKSDSLPWTEAAEALRVAFIQRTAQGGDHRTFAEPAKSDIARLSAQFYTFEAAQDAPSWTDAAPEVRAAYEEFGYLLARSGL